MSKSVDVPGQEHIAYSVYTDAINPIQVNNVVSTLTLCILVDFDALNKDTGSLEIDTTIVDRNLDVDVRNEADSLSYGSLTGISASGKYSIPLSSFPKTGKELVLIKLNKDLAAGTDPTINAATLFHK